MAGEGLIWAGIGQGIANAGSTMGSFLMRSQERETERDYRDKLEQERREYRDKTDQEKREYRAEQDALYKRTAAQQMEGRAGGGTGKDSGIQQADLEPGGKYAGMAAGRVSDITSSLTTENDLADIRKYRKSGEIDANKYGKPIGVGTTLDDTYGEQPVTQMQVPPALKEEFTLKAKALSRIEEAYALKGNFDDVKKGENTAFKTGVGQGVLAGTTKMGTGSGAVAASEGKPIINVEGGEQYNQYSGESKTTPLGKSQITENQAQAGQAGALAKKYGKDIEKIDAEIAGGMFNKNSSERLSSVINSANATIKSLVDGGKGSTKEAQAAWQKSMDDAVAVRDQAQALQRGALEAKNAPPAPTGAMPEPKSAADVAKLKPGTRFKAPDGSIRVR
jgi:hypothetical protein